MKLFYRRVVYVFFVLFFLIVTPLVILYTQGYRYNFQRSRIQKTGILIISSIPKKAAVYLNGKIVEDQQTPARIEKLLPADYEIKLAKEGYHDWQKKLLVNENSTTFAEDVILWKNSIPLQLDTKDITGWQISPERDKIAMLDREDQLLIFNIADEQFIALGNQLELTAPQLIGWSNTGKKLIIQDSVAGRNYYYLADLTVGAGDKIRSLTGKNYSAIKWDGDNDNLVYGRDKSGLWQIDLFTKKEKLITADQVNDFLVNNDEIFVLAGKNVLRLDEKSSIPAQVENEDYQLLAKKGSKLLALNESEQKIAVLDLDNANKNFTVSAKGLDWLSDHTLLFFNDWEIWIYNFEDDDPKLITRLGDKIVQALWHKSGRHIIFATAGEIRIIELDNRESRNVIAVASLSEIINLSLDAAGKNLYLLGRYSDQKEFLKLNIR